MNLPIYQQINFRHYSMEELQALLKVDLNIKHPVVMNLLELAHDEQREYIGVIENFFETQKLSFKFPYSVYVVSDHEPSITKMRLVQKVDDLPRFFMQKETKMNVKENHVLAKNKLLQLELKNNDAGSTEEKVDFYGRSHREIYELQEERLFYATILNKLMKAKK